ncbi:MAG: methionyl-tRNA formyltransferase [Pseudomonadota bacterium]
MKPPWKAIFMGTPAFAVPSIESLIRYQGVDIMSVVTQPDQPKGRGLTLTPSPVKVIAHKTGLPVLQPEKIRNEEFLNTIRKHEPDIIIVVAYGKILPKALLEIPEFGAVNVHGSLLPKYRGAAPVQWAIINGEKRTGVTIMKMDEGMDTGPVLLTEETEIRPADTSGALGERLAVIGADALIKALEGLREGTIEPRPQPETIVSYAPLLKKKDGLIDWRLSAGLLFNLIRGMDPWPGSYSFWHGKLCHFFKPLPVDNPAAGEPGEILAVDNSGLVVATGKGCILLGEIKLEGSRRMSVAEFRRGRAIKTGEVLG